MRKTHLVISIMVLVASLMLVGSGDMDATLSQDSRVGQQVASKRVISLDSLDQLPVAAATSDFPGSDPWRWRERLADTANIRYQEVFPGIDLVYAGTEQRLEAMLIVKPEADPAAIRLAFPLAEAIGLDAQGNVWAQTFNGTVGLLRPQFIPEAQPENPKSKIQNPKSVGFVRLDDHQVGLEVGEYDRRQPLVIRFAVLFPTLVESPVVDNIFFRRLGATEPPAAVASPEQATTVTATKTVNMTTADLGDTLMYTVTITNTGGATAMNVMFTDTIDGNTTLVGGSVNSSPIAVNDGYTASGNIAISIAAPGVLTNDLDPDTNNNTGLTVTQVQGMAGNVGMSTATTATGIGGVTGFVTLNANGSFTYEPPPGFTGIDTFTYQISDAGGKTDTATVTITISQMVWFINNNAGGSLNRGTFSNPFTSIASFNAVNMGAAPNPQPGQFIALRTGTGTYSEMDGINLRDNQMVIGEAVQFNTVFTADANSSAAYQTFASGTMAAPMITTSAGHGVDLASGNTARGFNVGNTPGFFGFNGGAVGSPTINTVGVTGTGGAINVSTSGAFGSNVMFSTLESSSSAGANINLVSVTGTLGITSPGSGLSGSAAGSAAININGGSVSLTYTGNVSKINSGSLLSVSNGHGGMLTFNTGTLSATMGDGLQFNNADGNYNFNGTTTLMGGDAGVDILNDSAGTFSFGTGTAITNPSGIAFNVDGLAMTSTANVTYSGNITQANNAAVASITNHTTGTITFNMGTLMATNGNGLQFSNADSTTSYNFNGTTTLGGGDAGIDILNGSGGTFNFGSSTTITSPSGTAFNVNGGSPTVTYSGNITQNTSSQRVVNIQGTTANTITFNMGTITGGMSSTGVHIGDTTAVNGNVSFANLNLGTSGSRMTNQAVTISGGTGTYSLGAVSIFTNNVSGIVATNADGTLNCTSGTVDSSNATAINIDGPAGLTTLGMTLTRVDSAGGTANGISLQDTNGSFTVNGDGSNTSVGGNGSGGTISGKSGADGSTSTGNGVYLSNASGVTLRRMTINGTNQNHGIRGVNSSDFTMEYMTVSGTNGTSAALDEGSVNFDNLTGAAAITNCLIEGGFEDNLNVVNTSGTLDRLVITGSTFGFNSTANGNNNILIESQNAGTMLKYTIQSSLIRGARSDWLNAQPAAGGTIDAIIGGSTPALGNSFDNTGANAHPGAVANGNRILLQANGTSTFNISNNTLKGSLGSALATNSLSATASMSGTIKSNTIGAAGTANSGSTSSSGISILSNAGGDVNVLIDDNDIFQYNNHGILLQFGDSMGSPPTISATVTNNTINTPGTLLDNFNGLHLNNGTTMVDSFTSCIHIAGNNLIGSGKGTATYPNNAQFRLRQRQSTTVILPGYAGLNNEDCNVIAFIAAQNTVSACGGCGAFCTTGTPNPPTVNGAASTQNATTTTGGFESGAACTLPSTAPPPPDVGEGDVLTLDTAAGSQESGVRDQGAGIREQGSGSRDQGAGIREQVQETQDPGQDLRPQTSDLRPETESGQPSAVSDQPSQRPGATIRRPDVSPVQAGLMRRPPTLNERETVLYLVSQCVLAPDLLALGRGQSAEVNPPAKVETTGRDTSPPARLLAAEGTRRSDHQPNMRRDRLAVIHPTAVGRKTVVRSVPSRLAVIHPTAVGRKEAARVVLSTDVVGTVIGCGVPAPNIEYPSLRIAEVLGWSNLTTPVAISPLKLTQLACHRRTNLTTPVAISPNGAIFNSPGQRPGNEHPIMPQAPTGRNTPAATLSGRALDAAPSGLVDVGATDPGALPQAIASRSFGASEEQRTTDQGRRTTSRQPSRIRSQRLATSPARTQLVSFQQPINPSRTPAKAPASVQQTKDQGPGTRDQGPGTRDQGPGTRDQIPKVYVGTTKDGVPIRIVASPASGETVVVGPFNLPAGESTQIMFSVTVDNPLNTPASQVCNQGTVTFTGGPMGGVLTDDPSVMGPANPTCTTLNLADVTVSKSGPATITCGNTITYTLTASNSGTASAANTAVSDDLPDCLSNVMCMTSQGTCSVGAGNVVTANLGTLAASGGSATITITATVNAGCAPSISNTASIATTTGESNTGNNTSTTVTTTVECADVMVSKSGPASIVCGNTISYTLTAGNSGTTSAANVTVTDDLPDCLSNVMCMTSQGTCSVGAGNVVTAMLGTLAASGGSATITITATVNGSCTPSLSNTASISTTTGELNSGNNTSATVTTTVQCPDVTVSKSGPASVVCGNTISYTLTASNSGTADAANVTVTDDLPDCLTNVTCMTSQGTCSVGAGNVVTASLGTIMAGGSATVTLTATVDPGCAPSLSNTASVTTSSTESNTGNNTSNTVTTTVQCPDVTVSKSGPATIVCGNTITYTLTASNSGTADAANVTVTDDLPDCLTNVMCLVGQGTCSVGAGNVVTASLGTIMAGGSATITITATVDPSCAPSISNTATISTSSVESNTMNNTSSTVTTTVQCPDVTISKSGPATIVCGDTITYTLTVTNSGDAGASNVTVTDDLPDCLTTVMCLTSQGTCSVGAGNVVTASLGTINASGTATITITATVPPGCAPSLSNTASVTTSSTESSSGNNTSNTVTTAVQCPDVTISKSGPASIGCTNTITYTLTVSNTGDASAANVTATDDLPDCLTNVMCLTSQGTCAVGAGNVVTASLGTLAASGSATITITATVDPSCVPSLSNTASVTTTSTESNTMNNTSTTVMTMVGCSDVGITKSGPATIVCGNTISYTLTVANGGSTAADNVTVTDDLPDCLSNVMCTPSQGSCSVGAGNVVTALLGTVAASGSATVTITATVNPSCAPSLSNTASVTTTSPESTTANNTSNTVTTTVQCPDVVVSKSGPATVVCGSTITYTLTAQNTGDASAANVTVTDDLPDCLTNVMCTPSQGTCLVGAGNVVTANLGTIGASGMATITITATVPPSCAPSISNTAMISTSSTELNTGNNTSTTVMTTVTCPDLTISKSGPASIVCGDMITYTLTASNTGNADAANVVITDDLPDCLTTVIVTDCDTGSAEICVVTGGGAGNVLMASVGTMAPGQMATLTITATVPPGCGSSISNTASVTTSSSESSTGNNTSNTVTTTVECANLTISKSGPSSIVCGNTITYTLTATNAGTANADNVMVTDDLPDCLTNVMCSTSVGSCAVGAGNVVTATLGTLAPSASATITITATVPVGCVPSLSNTASASTTSPESDTNNTSTTVTTAVLCADLQVTKTDSPDPVGLGDNLTYTVVVKNNGPGSATGVTLTDVVPANTTFVSNSGAAGWTCMNPSPGGTGTISCTNPTLTDGAMATFTIVVKVDPASCGAVIGNTATVMGSAPEVNTGNNTAMTTTATSNDPPMVNAGPDQSVIQGQKVTLMGMVMDADPGQTLTFVWMQTSGPGVTLTMANTLMPMFMAPAVPEGQCVTLTFKLMVTDPCGDMAMDTVMVAVEGAGEEGFVLQDSNGNCLRLFLCSGKYIWRKPDGTMIMNFVTITKTGTTVTFQSVGSDPNYLTGGVDLLRRTGNARIQIPRGRGGQTMSIVDFDIDNNPPCS